MKTRNIKHYILVFLCAPFVLTLANAEMNDTHYETLKKAFAQAQPASINDITGWRSGRCYLAVAPNYPKNALMATAEVNNNTGNKAHSTSYKAAFISNKIRGSEYYDALSENALKHLEDSVNTQYESSEPLVQKDGSLLSVVYGNLVNLRKGVLMPGSSDEYVLERKTYSIFPEERSVIRYCYYLNEKVRD